MVVTRTGRPFFAEPKLEASFLERPQQALGAAGFGGRFERLGRRAAERQPVMPPIFGEDFLRKRMFKSSTPSEKAMAK